MPPFHRATSASSARRLHQPHQPSAKDDISQRRQLMMENSSSADVSFRARPREGERRSPARVGAPPPDWRVFKLLPSFHERYPSNRFRDEQNPGRDLYPLLTQHVMTCVEDENRRAILNCETEQAMANFCFSAGALVAARVFLGRSAASPMGRFLWGLETCDSPSELAKHGAARNLSVLDDELDRLGVDLSELLDVGHAEHCIRTPSAPAPSLINRAEPMRVIARDRDPLPVPEDFGKARARQIALTRAYETLSVDDRYALDTLAHDAAVAQLGLETSAERLRFAALRHRQELLVELFPEAMQRASSSRETRP